MHMSESLSKAEKIEDHTGSIMGEWAGTLDAAGTLAVGDEVRATGTAGQDGELVVCERATHYLVEEE